MDEKTVEDLLKQFGSSSKHSHALYADCYEMRYTIIAIMIMSVGNLCDFVNGVSGEMVKDKKGTILLYTIALHTNYY